MFKLNIHSVVDVITNSSTVIYTYTDGCVSPVYELFNEIIKMNGGSQKAEDLFYIGSYMNAYTYCDYLEEIEEDDEVFISEEFKSSSYKEQISFVEWTIEKVLIGEIKKPKWMKWCEEQDKNSDSYRRSTNLYIKSKDEKYNDMINIIKKVVGSVETDGGMD